jgi:predicted metal-dependent hydrolase
MLRRCGMSAERELLKRVFDTQHTLSAQIAYEIEELLAEPEQKPLTREEISYGFRTNDDAINAESFWAGVEWAEKMHGITGDSNE